MRATEHQRSSNRWRGKASAALLGGLLVMALVAGAVSRAYDAPALERIYAGVFIGVSAWLFTLLYTLLAANGAIAWQRLLCLLALAATLWLLGCAAR